jgi:hypothetical protein
MSPADERAQLLGAVLGEDPVGGLLAPLQAPLRAARAEAIELARTIPWGRQRDTTLALLQNEWADMLIAIQRFFGPAGERLLDDPRLHARPVDAGHLIRYLYLQSILLTRRPDPFPFVFLVYAMAASGHGKRTAPAHHVSNCRIRSRWRATGLPSERRRLGEAGRKIRRPDPKGRQARRPARRATHQVRAGHQPEDRQGAGTHDPAICADAGRPGD